MHYKNLTIIGTSHIAPQSVQEVQRTIEKLHPEIVALELDRKRFYALTHEGGAKLSLRDIKLIGIKGFLFNLFGAWLERKLGKIVGVKPGSEMLAAAQSAKKINAKIALVDQDISITLSRISKEITWREKLKFIIDILFSAIFGRFMLKRKKIKIDLKKVPSAQIIAKLTKELKKHYPTLYKVLVEERNQVIAKNLCTIMKDYPVKPILAVIGAGHERDVLNIIKEIDKKIYKLK